VATVRFSKELTDAILSNAKQKMQPGVERAKESKLDPAWGQRIYDKLFPVDVRSTVTRLPDYWFEQKDKITVDSVAGNTCSMDFPLNGKYPWPAQFPDTELACKRYSFRDGIVLKEHPEWEDLATELRAFWKRLSDAHQKQTEYVTMVEKVINAYSTLAPALKAWPPLWDLVPEGYREKHREIKERGKNVVTLDVDLDKLTALTTAAKFGI
jgi:hypothetical protein